MNKQEMLDEFGYKLTVRTDMLRAISRNYDYAYYLFNTKLNNELAPYKLQFRYNCFRLIILDVPGLFADNEKTHKMNFHKFLDQLEKGKFKKLKMPIDRIEYYRNEFESRRKAIIGITSTRDGYIAHIEKLFGLGPSPTFFPTIKDLVTLGFDLLHECSETILKKPVYNVIDKTHLNDLLVY